MTSKYDPEEYEATLRTAFQKDSDEELVKSFNSQVGNPGWAHARSIYLHELRCEFERRNWDYSVIKSEGGGFCLAKGNEVYLKEKKLLHVRKIIKVEIGNKVVVGEIINRTRLWITVKIINPFCFWKTNIGIPLQALETTKHFWGRDGDEIVTERAKGLLIECYNKVKIIDENIDIFVAQYDILQEELNEIDKLEESEIKKNIKNSLWKGFHNNLYLVYRLQISIYDKEQLEQIILAYKNNKTKIYNLI